MLLRQTLLYLPAQVLGPIVQFLSIVLWTYFLDPTEMGTFALITAAQEFGYIATTFWFTLYTMRYFDRNAAAHDKTAFMNTEAGVMLAAALATAFGVMALPLFIDVVWSPALGTAAMAYCLSRTLATHLTDRARTAQDTLVYTIMQVSWPVLGLALGVAFVKAFSATAGSVLWGYAVAQCVALAGILGRLGLGRRPYQLSVDIIRTGLRFGMPLVIGGLFVWLANNGLRFVIEHEEGATAVGLITVGWGLGIRAAAFAAMLVTAAAFPLAVARSRESGMAEGQAQLVRSGVLLLAVLAPAAGGLWAISDPLVERMVAAPFREMTAAVLPWAILAGAARNLRIHFGEQVFLLREETKIPLANDAFDGLSTIAGGAIGLAMGGLPGSVAGAACGATASLLVTLSCGAYLHGFALPAGHVVRIATATAAMIGALHFLPMAPTVFSLALAIATGGTVYALALVALYPFDVGIVLSKFRALRQA
ncbi:MAG TPA: lipopolysaccharide biosynthesis protein [Hyphomicrobium sp.]|nr:lipopolysaccharide biosynthesis protein [Hyphomicrobium sp.]